MSRNKDVVVSCIAVTLGIVFASACSQGSTVDYPLPDDLCGHQIERELYEPLFPPGKSIELSSPNISFIGLCHATVDGKVVIMSKADGGKHEERYPGMGVGEGGALADGLRVEGEFDAWVWPGSAMATTPCTVPGTLKDFTLVIDTKYPKDPEESKRVLAELIQPFMQAAVARAPCEEHEANDGH